MSKTSIPAHGAVHMSPAQAAQQVGLSRWTIMRAIKSNEIRAFRDNRNQWRISEQDLFAWRSSSVRTSEEVHTSSAPIADEALHQKVAELTIRAEVAEALLARERELNESLSSDREHWRQQAMLLSAPAKKKKWWSWAR